MQAKLQATRLASQDYKQVLDYTIEQWGVEQYRKYRTMLREAIERIAEEPFNSKSRTRPDLFEGARIYPIGRHYLVYYISDEIVILARILHQQMDLPRHLEEI